MLKLTEYQSEGNVQSCTPCFESQKKKKICKYFLEEILDWCSLQTFHHCS